MIKTTIREFVYMGLDFTGYTATFNRKTIEKALSDASEWMNEHSDTFIRFEYQTGEFMNGKYVARHTSAYKNESSHVNGSCIIYPTTSGKSWSVSLYMRRGRHHKTR